jgi:hypothetical protein
MHLEGIYFESAHQLRFLVVKLLRQDLDFWPGFSYSSQLTARGAVKLHLISADAMLKYFELLFGMTSTRVLSRFMSSLLTVE